MASLLGGGCAGGMALGYWVVRYLGSIGFRVCFGGGIRCLLQNHTGCNHFQKNEQMNKTKTPGSKRYIIYHFTLQGHHFPKDLLS